MASPSVQNLPSTTDTSKRKLPTSTSNSAKRSAASISTSTPENRAMILQVHYSDGIEKWQDGDNGPPLELLDDTPDENGAQSFMRPVLRLEKKSLEWLRILAEGLIISSADPPLIKDLKEGTKLFFLSRLPDGYRLFEHIRNPGNTGGKGRKDTYLYGHPKGPRKRFRSPGDFLVHLKWLVSDQIKNPSNCGCVACKGGAVGALSPPATPAAVATVSGPAVPPPVPATARTQVLTTRRSSQPPAITKMTYRPSPPQGSVSIPPESAQPTVPDSIVLSGAILQERNHDMQFPGLTIYRLGEQVWFATGPHWAIGVVIGVPVEPLTNYRVQPLQSPLICEQGVAHNDIPPTQLRPWVAWSTPPITNKKLNTISTVPYENLPWRQESGTISFEVDASILRSRDVDISYTLIGRLTPQNHYSAVYYGAERFWAGDAVRIKASANLTFSSPREIMVVSTIQDLVPNTATGIRTRDTGVVITGDVYRITTHAHSVPPPSGLPSAVLGDLSARARFSTSEPATPYWTYTQISTGLTVKLEEIKGRWYPGSSLFRIVHGLERFKNLASTASINSEEWDATGSRMNEMGTGGSGTTLGWRRYEHRHQAFNKAIPSRLSFTPVLGQGDVSSTTQNEIQSLGLHQSAEPIPANINTHTAHTVSEPIDLTGDSDEGMEFLADHDSVDEEFMKRMGEDAASFLADDGDFYGGL